MKKSEIVKKIDTACERCREYIELSKSSTNPQEIAIRNEKKGMLLAFEACKDALYGSPITLNILASKP